MSFQKGHKINNGKKYSKERRLKISMAHLGKKLTPETRAKMSVSKRKNPIRYWLGKKHSKEHNENIRKSKLGKTMSEETKQKISESHRGAKAYNWKGGATDNRHKVTSLAYKRWVSDVFSRDNWTCQTCGIRGVYLQAHHIKSWAHYPELRRDVSNGVTLCVPCHKLTDNFRGKNKNKHE